MSELTGGTPPEVIEVKVRVNGRVVSCAIPPRRSLADMLRLDLGLTGTNLGCEHGSCGTCTVLVDGLAVRSCLELGARVTGREIITVEGLGSPASMSVEQLHPIQKALAARHGLQCGYCTPGMLLAAVEYLNTVGVPDEHAIRDHLSGNLCRCTGYQGIVDAVMDCCAASGDTTRSGES